MIRINASPENVWNALVISPAIPVEIEMRYATGRPGKS
jgi:hypothetical protein